MSAQWREEIPCGVMLTPGYLREDTTMAGFLRADIEVRNDRSYDVIPDTCPAQDEHRPDTPRCYVKMFDGERRQCTYWIACTASGNSTERADVTVLEQRMAELGSLRRRCGVICQRARANIAPGC